ncbi:TonB-dependent receptor [Myroides pelagicus]|uniref:TonB-dependent receptor n=1 Tax=Myroides pelagicus TaxID=270914 RepID=A0A7K1GSZ4_9FLAO|nr:TonB-dependent receptor [Myroides pelagicus]MTH30924.1 TonB-dependent receptor [Myroides pelagicus]
MKRIVILWWLLLLSTIFYAQSSTTAVKGIVVSEKEEPLAFVTIIAKDVHDDVVKSMYTDELGAFEFFVLEEFNQLEFSYIGFKTKQYLMSDSIPDIIELESVDSVLDELTIIAKKPMVKREVDRLIFNVEDTPLASTNAWEILSQTPGVSAIGDQLSIRGKESILVTINDKKVMLTGDQLKDLLEGTDGSLVEAVEVITNPPAKYDAQGSAVLNIKLKKEVALGYKGSVGSKYKQTTYAFNTLSTQHTYTGEKINLSGSYSFANGKSVRYNRDNVIYENGDRWDSDFKRMNKSHGKHSFQTALDVKIDTTLTLTIGGDGFINELTKGDYVIPTLIYNKEGVVESNYTTSISKRANMDTYTLYTLLDKKFSKKKHLLWSSYFTYDLRDDNQDVLTLLNFKGELPSERFYATKDTQRARLFVSGIDYTIGGESSKWELGGKYSIVKALYDLDFYDKSDGNLGYRREKSNNYDYQELNWAGYTSYTQNWEKWQLKAGLRGEYSIIQTSTSGIDANDQSYFKVFPTFYLKRDLTEEQSLTFSYGKRIYRPSYSWMNPAKSFYNLFSYFKGDPNLKPTISHNFSIGYDYNYWSVEAMYSHEINPVMEISFQEEDTNTLVYHMTNIDRRRQLGLVLNTPYKVGDWLLLNSYFIVGYQEDYFYGEDKKLYKNDAFGVMGRLFASVDLHKKSNWKAMMTYTYSSPSVQGTFQISSYQRTDLTMSREFLAGRLVANLYVYNIFGSDRQIIKTQYANQNNYFKDYRDTQGFAISLKYNFGNQKIKYEDKEIDMKDKDRL